MSDTLILTPEKLIDHIKYLQEKKGVKAFAVSAGMHGKAAIPSNKLPFYRIPCIVAELFKTPRLGNVMNNFLFIVSITDLELCNEDFKKAHQENLDAAKKNNP